MGKTAKWAASYNQYWESLYPTSYRTAGLGKLPETAADYISGVDTSGINWTEVFYTNLRKTENLIDTKNPKYWGENRPLIEATYMTQKLNTLQGIMKTGVAPVTSYINPETGATVRTRTASYGLGDVDVPTAQDLSAGHFENVRVNGDWGPGYTTQAFVPDEALYQTKLKEWATQAYSEAQTELKETLAPWMAEYARRVNLDEKIKRAEIKKKKTEQMTYLQLAKQRAATAAGKQAISGGYDALKIDVGGLGIPKG